MSGIETVMEWLAPWQSLYANSKLVSNAVTGAHLVGVLWAGGLAIAADRATLRLERDEAARNRQLEELGLTHRPVVIALTIVFLSGVLQAAADLKTFLGTPVFWLKLGLVLVLLLNGGLIVRTERSLRIASGPEQRNRLWQRLRTSSWASLTLWTITVVVGVWLTSAA